MNAEDLIETYVTEVAVRLPRDLRNDVAFELRALLGEELQAKAAAAGREADETVAAELLRAFGHPSEVAERYRPTLTIIDPVDGPTFVKASLIGLAIIWGVGLMTHFRPPVESVSDFVLALGRWWSSTLIPSMWWPGVLVVWFGLSSWARRRRRRSPEWAPRGVRRSNWNRVGMAMGLVGMALGIAVLIEPRWLLDVFFGGRAAPAAYEALTYTDTFRHRQAPWVLVLLLLNVPMAIAAIVNGRSSSLLRRVEVELSLVTCAVLAWTVVDGPVLGAPASDLMARTILAIIVVLTLIGVGVKLRRSVRPAPSRQANLGDRAS